MKFINKIGSSSKNKDKFKIVESMPEWLKPSGVFGIGLQSYFAVTDKIRFETKSKLNYEALLIDMNNPMKKGSVLIEKKNREEISFGNKLSFEMIFDNIPKTIAYFSYRNSEVEKAISNFDPIKDKTMDYSIGKILEQIIWFKQISPFPIELEMDNEDFKFKYESNENNNDYNELTRFFDPKTNIELFLDFDYLIIDRINVFYRNAYADDKSLRGFLLCDLDANFLKGKAIDYLTLNRNKIKSGHYYEVRNECCKALKNIIPEYYKNIDKLTLSDEGKETKKQIVSLFIENYFPDDKNIKESLQEDINKWKDIDLKKICDNGEEFKLSNRN